MGQLQHTSTGDFNRVESGGTFRVEKPVTRSNSYPPSRVTDSKVVAMEVDSTSLTIEWTAPGQELDSGTATEYQIKYSDVFDNLLEKNFGSKPVKFEQKDVIGGSLQPLESGSKQRVSLALPDTIDPVTYYIALRATNKRNVASYTSNVVSVQLAYIIQPPTQASKADPTPAMSSTTDTHISSTGKSSSSSSSTASIRGFTEPITILSPEFLSSAGSSGLKCSSDLLCFFLSALLISNVHSIISSWINRD